MKSASSGFVCIWRMWNNPKHRLSLQALVLPALVCLVVSCTRNYQPKPHGYNRLVLPEPAYFLSPDTLPYRFEYSRHARLLRDTSWIRDRHWVEIYYPQLNATIH